MGVHLGVFGRGDGNAIRPQPLPLGPPRHGASLPESSQLRGEEAGVGMVSSHLSWEGALASPLPGILSEQLRLAQDPKGTCRSQPKVPTKGPPGEGRNL